MTDSPTGMPERSYGCTYACGNPYDVVMIDIKNATTEFLCIPCFVQLAAQMVQAMTDPQSISAGVMAEAYRLATGEQAPGPTAKPGRKNAPATNDDPDMFAAYDATLTTEELPEEFR